MWKSLYTVYGSLQQMFVEFLRLLPALVLAMVVLGLFYVGARAARRVIARVAGEKSAHASVGLVLGRLAQGGLVLLGVLVALMIAVPSFKPGQLVQVLGIGSVAIGFAFRDILQNFLAGILILLTQPFRIGDQIIITGFEGTVENIETRATFLRTYDGRRVVIPNSVLFTESVMVNTAFETRRLQYDVGVGYGDDVGKVQELILATLAGIKGVLKDPAPEAVVTDLAGSTVNVRARWWIDPPRKIDVIRSTSEVLVALKDALTEAGVDLPYPTQQILFHDQTEETDGDRARQREGWPARTSGNPRARAAVLRESAGAKEQG